jgi:hypothetical protein
MLAALNRPSLMAAILSAMLLLCHWSIKVFIFAEKCSEKLVFYSDIPLFIVTSSFILRTGGEKKQTSG